MALISQTLAQIRRRTADVLGDMRQLTATSNGTTTTFVDTFNVNTGTDDYRKCEILFTSSPNDGLVSVVTSVTQSTGTITFTPARTSTQSSNTAELYRMRGTGFQVAEYHRAINDAIQELHGVYLIDSMQDVTDAYDADTQYFVSPATMHKMYRVEYQTTEGYWKEIPPANRPGSLGGWTPEPTTGNVRIEGRIAQLADTLSLRCWGYTLQAALSADADICYYDAEAVALKAAMRLCFSRIGGPESSYGQKYLTLEKMATKAIAMDPMIEDPQTRIVRV
jgi:hypothetical protein